MAKNVLSPLGPGCFWLQKQNHVQVNQHSEQATNTSHSSPRLPRKPLFQTNVLAACLLQCFELLFHFALVHIYSSEFQNKSWHNCPLSVALVHLCLLLKRSFLLFAHSEPKKPLKFCFIQPAANMLDIDHVFKRFPELQARIFPVNCLVFLNVTPGTLLTWALRDKGYCLTFIPWCFSVPWLSLPDRVNADTNNIKVASCLK